MGIRLRITAALQKMPKSDSRLVAKYILDRTPKREMIALLAEEVDHVRRIETRKVETSAFRSFFSKSARTPELQSLDTLRPAFAEKFNLGEGFVVQWGKATVEQHRRRIAMLAKLRNGLSESIRRHEYAIQLLEQSGASCLDEIKVIAA